jgi:hypothetical protein
MGQTRHIVGAQSIRWCQVNGQSLYPSGVENLLYSESPLKRTFSEVKLVH